MLTPYLNITAGFALHSSESDCNIISYLKPFSVVVALRTALVLYLTLYFEMECKM